MSEGISFSIGGRPVQWQRAGTVNGRRFTPRAMAKALKAVKDAAKSAMAGREPFTGPVRLTVIAIYEIPKSWPKHVREACERGEVYHTSVPDLDNLVKLCGDAMNGVAYVDDCQVAEHMSRKRYGYPQRTDIAVTPLAGVLAGSLPPPTPAEARRKRVGTNPAVPQIAAPKLL